jgi:hypothetical protein
LNPFGSGSLEKEIKETVGALYFKKKFKEPPVPVLSQKSVNQKLSNRQNQEFTSKIM